MLVPPQANEEKEGLLKLNNSKLSAKKIENDHLIEQLTAKDNQIERLRKEQDRHDEEVINAWEKTLGDMYAESIVVVLLDWFHESHI